MKNKPDPSKPTAANADAGAMFSELPIYIYIGLGLVAYFMIVNILRSLGAVHRHEISVHNLLRDSHAMRRAYLEEVRARQENFTESVEVIEE